VDVSGHDDLAGSVTDLEEVNPLRGRLAFLEVPLIVRDPGQVQPGELFQLVLDFIPLKVQLLHYPFLSMRLEPAWAQTFQENRQGRNVTHPPVPQA
jgi:hypothetical protein